MAKAPGLEGLVAGELRRAIAADGRSIDAVGQAAGFSRSYLSQLLRGRQDLKLQHVERVLAVLELDPDSFLRRVQEALWDAGLASGPPMAASVAGGARAGRGRDSMDSAAEEARLGLREVVREIVREELARGDQEGPRDAVKGTRSGLDLGFEEVAPSDLPRRDEKAEGQDQGASAGVRLREILALPEEERPTAVRRNPGRYSGTELAQFILDEARGHLPAEPRRVYGLAGLARLVLQHGERTPEAMELYALVQAHEGNALRAQGQLRSAEDHFESARFLLGAHGSGSSLTRAELDSLEGSLRFVQRRFEEAVTLLSRAAQSYLTEERKLEAARTELKMGTVFWQTGELERAIKVSERASEIFAGHGETRLLLMARHNLARYYLDAGDIKRSRAILTESLPLYDCFPDPWTQLRRLWLEGHLARTEGNFEAAEDAFRSVRDGFLEQGVGYDAAMAALDLAFLYAERGRTAALKRLAEEIAPIFSAQDVHQEAAAALMLFQEAVRQERASVRFLGELSRYLEQARRDPELRFRQSDAEPE